MPINETFKEPLGKTDWHVPKRKGAGWFDRSTSEGRELGLKNGRTGVRFENWKAISFELSDSILAEDTVESGITYKKYFVARNNHI